ncbi:hypothetical protein JCM3765_006088 [Sporobolomyces pararoseus]
MSTITNETNPRGIPKAAFIESVPDFIGGPDGDAESALKALEESLSKYRFMEQSSLSRKQGLEEKIPELSKTLEMIKVLIRKKEEEESFETSFELSDTLYAKGVVEKVDQVYIWLGASTMLSYPLPTALELLTLKLSTAEKSLINVREDLGFLRDQITVCEVGIARVYNWDVARRRERRKAEELLQTTGTK